MFFKGKITGVKGQPNIFQGDVRCLKGGHSEDMSEDKEDEDNGYEYKDSMKPLRKKRRRTER